MSEKIIQILKSCSRLELYRDNGFRRLGLRVPADTRAVMRRLDELRVSLELGRGLGGWSFAPAGPVTSDGLRESTRHLQDPLRRLLDEFFWFWPEAYPESGDDAALDVFMAGDTGGATAIWSESAGRGASHAWHNLAVYQHLLALEWLDQPGVEFETRRSLWNEVLDYWRRVLADDGVWRLLEARIRAINDPQLPVSVAALLRGQLPAILARIHAAAAVRLTMAEESGRAAFHLECMTVIQPECDVAEVLEPFVQPILRRLSVQIAEVRRSAAARLSDIESVWEMVCADLTILQQLGPASGAAFADLQRQLAETLLDRLENLHSGGGDAGEALLHHLLILDLSSEGPGGGRAEKQFSNTLARALTVYRPDLEESERIRRLLIEVVLPGLGRLKLSPVSLASAHARVAVWMQMLGETAMSSSPAMLPWSLQTLRPAEALPLDEESRAALQSTLHGWAVSPRVGRRPALLLSGQEHTLRIDVVGITLDGARIEATGLTGICHNLPGFGIEAQPVLRWSNATRVVELPAVFAPNESGLREVLSALYQLVLPHLFGRILGAVRGGLEVPIGLLKLHSSGIFTSDSPNPRPYTSVRLASGPEGITLTDHTDPEFVLKLDPANDWNVPLLPLLLLILTPR